MFSFKEDLIDILRQMNDILYVLGMNGERNITFDIS